MADFSSHEIAAARLELLRSRVQTTAILAGCVVVTMPLLAAFAVAIEPQRDLRRPELLAILASVVVAVAIAAAPHLRRRRLATAEATTLLRRSALVILLATVANVASASLVSQGITLALRPVGFEGRIGPGLPLAIQFILLHTVMAALLPWTLWEALRPCLLMLLLGVVAMLVARDSLPMATFGGALLLASCLPGLAITFLRRSSIDEWLRLKVAADRYDELRRELGVARRIHERLLPQPIAGPIGFDYRYEPMDEIGGDIVFAAVERDGALHVSLIDVTGHGVAAALAVNRLQGELQRLRSDGRSPGPAEVLAALNDYVHAAFADDRVLATAIELRIEPDGTLRWANAGHPPGVLLRRAGGTEHLGATATLLGAIPRAEFGDEEHTTHLADGDRVVIYTDGAFECVNSKRGMLGLEAFLHMVETRPRSAALGATLDGIRAQVLDFAEGSLKDDCLIAGIERSP